MNFTLELTKPQIDALLDYYTNEQNTSNNPYVIAVVKKPRVTVTVYTTHKVLFQGEDSEFEMLFWSDAFKLDVKIDQKENSDYFLTSIGSDESGVGDFFGPLTVASAYVKESDQAFLSSLKINDSKKLTDQHILTIAPKIIEKIPYSLLVLSNKQYNALTKKGYNAHKLKAHMHSQTHKHLLQKIQKNPIVIIDQFCNKALYLKYTNDFDKPVIPDIFKTKAESYYASVAVASIIARYSYITHLDKLSKAVGMVLPKGASSKVDDAAKSLVKSKGKAIFDKVAKTHFKTLDKISE